MSSIVTVYAVFSSREEAERIGRTMVEGGHATCVNILAPCHSIFLWRGAVQTSDEVPALFKTPEARSSGLIAAIAEAHSYDVPAIVTWPIADAWPPYEAWVKDPSADKP